MDEWQRLEKDNLPPDILTGDYEFVSGEEGRIHSSIEKSVVLGHLFMADPQIPNPIFYRRTTPRPTHEEIMTKWWRVDRGYWLKVVSYDPEGEGNPYYISANWRPLSYFQNRPSADIPPKEAL